MSDLEPPPLPPLSAPPLPSTGTGGRRGSPRVCGFAVASLVLGGVAVLLFAIGVFGVFAIVFGHAACSSIKRSHGALRGRGLALGGLVLGYVSLIGFLLIVISLVRGVRHNLDERALSEKQQGELFDIESVPLPRFPDQLPEGRLVGSTQVRAVPVRFGGVDPGQAMQARVYLPPEWNDAADHSLPAVLVAPAGTNLISGSRLDDGDYHDETLPYAQAGMVVIFYSIDGETEEERPDETDEQTMDRLSEAYEGFRDAKAGVVNGRNALEYTLSHLPKVNPERIYTAGHSSAATLALLFAMHEPRLAGCAAYAPCTDVAAWHRKLANEPSIELFINDLRGFLKRSSPITHAEKLQCPLFLFHSKADRTAKFGESERLVRRLRKHAPHVDVTFHAIDAGDHYYPMIEEGIPAAIRWMQSHPQI